VHLKRMLRVEVAARVPPVRGARQQHRRVLARAVHPHPFGLAELAHELVARRGVAGPGRRALQAVLAEAGPSQDLPDHRGVPVGAAVARRRERELLALQRHARRQAAQGLQRLHARARQDGRLDVAEAQPDDAFRVEHDRRARVPRLDEAAALDDGELDGVADRDGSVARGRSGGGVRI